MTWVPPFFICGECGGEIGRWPMLNLLRQEILDWRHRSVPDAWQNTPHRAVLGTPAHKPAILTAEPDSLDDENTDDVVAPDPVPPPEIPARRALAGDLPKGAKDLDKLAAANGWEVEAWVMRGTRMDARWKVGRVATSVVLRMHRDGHRLIASWQTDAQDKWAFEFGMSLTHYVEMVNSPRLRKIIAAPRMICQSCLEPFALHVLTAGGPVCHSEYLTATTGGH